MNLSLPFTIDQSSNATTTRNTYDSLSKNLQQISTIILSHLYLLNNSLRIYILFLSLENIMIPTYIIFIPTLLLKIPPFLQSQLFLTITLIYTLNTSTLQTFSFQSHKFSLHSSPKLKK